MRAIDRKMSREDFYEIATLWLVGTEAANRGDIEARDFFTGTFGPWASEILRLRRS